MIISDVITELGEALAKQYLLLDGTSGTFASTPDSAALSVTGDIDVRVKAAADDWSSGSRQTLAGQYVGLPLTDRVWVFWVNTNGTLRCDFQGSAAGLGAPTSSATTGFSDGSAHWVRFTRASASGDVEFFTSDDGETWTQLGSTQSTTSGDLNDSDIDVRIGGRGGGEFFLGNVFYAEVRDGIDGTVVADPDFGSLQPWQPGETENKDAAGNTWTLNGNAEIVRDGINGLRVYDYVADNVQVPAAVIAFPDEYEYDVTMNRGVDRVSIPMTLLVGKVSDRSTRDALSKYVDGSGSSSIKQVLNAGSYTAFSSHRVSTVDFSVITVAGVDYMAATFNVDVWGSGN